MTYTVLNIFEDDFGCEEYPEGAEELLTVYMKAEDGSEVYAKAGDGYLRRMGIDVGSTVSVEPDGTLIRL